MPAYGRWNLILILLKWRILWASSNASRWQMGFNLAFKVLTDLWHENGSKFSVRNIVVLFVTAEDLSALDVRWHICTQVWSNWYFSFGVSYWETQGLLSFLSLFRSTTGIAGLQGGTFCEKYRPVPRVTNTQLLWRHPFALFLIETSSVADVLWIGRDLKRNGCDSVSLECKELGALTLWNLTTLIVVVPHR